MFKISKSRFLRSITMHMVLLMSFQAAFPTNGFALTSGPSQPEFAGFEPATTTEMVDLFSGDFTYNIPLFELPGPDGGYPFNLAYNSGVSMDQEASWVGLGWSLNPGAINRNLRGVPDEFNGEDIIRKRTDMLPSKTTGFTVNGHLEIFGFDPDKLPNPDDSKGKLNLALNVTHNNYTGWGLGVNVGGGIPVSENVYAGANLGINSMEGANISANVSLSAQESKFLNSYNLGFGLNSREGLTNFSLSASRKMLDANSTGEKFRHSALNAGLGFTHNFGRKLFIPNVTSDKSGSNFAPGFEFGWWSGATQLGAGVDAYFTEEREAHRNIYRDYKGVGYMHSKNLDDTDRSIMDFNKDNVAVIGEHAMNIATPISSPDVFMVQGQGTGGSFRAHRSDVGTYSDPYYKTNIGGGKLGAELGAGIGADLGLELGGNWSTSKNKKWDDIQNIFEFDNNKNPNSDYEPYYFKGASEHTADPNGFYDNIMGDDPVKLAIKKQDGFMDVIERLGITKSPSKFVNQFEGKLNIDSGENFKRANGQRKARANNLQPITNEELLVNQKEGLAEYGVKYFEFDPSKSYLSGQGADMMNTTTLDRKKNRFPSHHMAGFTALQPSGLRYVYGLPVRNFTQHDFLYSLDPNLQRNANVTKTIDIDHSNEKVVYAYPNADNSDDFINETITPQYNSAHLLTCVLGSDYIDLDDEPGPSDGDYGYWVKFNYAKIAVKYQWKAPFEGANFVRNSISSERDDRGAFTHGSREQYYMATAETRTHLAVFNIRERADAKGVPSPLHNTGEDLNSAASSYLLHQIDLYSKLSLEQANAVPIKSVKLEYDYALCPGVPNNDNGLGHNGHDGQAVNNAGGKLTLQKLWFTYENSQRGKLSPYDFHYENNQPYNTHNYDRWGNYQAMAENEAIDFPYTKQAEADVNASAWSMDKIDMPSGSSIQVEYESDDYAYVQDRRAMRMFNLAIKDGGPGPYEVPTEEIKDLDSDLLKVYFHMDNSNDNFEDYFKDVHGASIDVNGDLKFSSRSQLLFKIRSELNSPDALPDNSAEEFITLYADINHDHPDVIGQDGSMPYVRLNPINLGTEKNKKWYHPFCATAWQTIKAKYPSIINNQMPNNDDPASLGNAMGDFVTNFKEIFELFRKFYTRCSREKYGSTIDDQQSFVRLCDPDQIKEGGGARVRQITLVDNWDVNQNGDLSDDVDTYGQVYEYTTEEDGNKISSGVAINEPFIGGEESALKYAKISKDEIRFRANEYQVFEYPINASLYPGASVGYSKVTVKSLATDIRIPKDHPTDPPKDLPDGFGVTGVTVNEFYTAKDYPVVTKETILDQDVGKPHAMFVGIGMIKKNFFAGSQGYAITLNDMHGKPSKITHFGLDSGGDVLSKAENSISYKYFDEGAQRTELGAERNYKVLNNEVDVLLSDNSVAGIAPQPQELGVEREFVVQADRFTGSSGNVDVGVNFDFTTPFIFALTAWPSFNLNFSSTKTAATNKIIRRSGILESVTAFDGQAEVITYNKVFDPMTGEALVTSVKNEFNNDVYNYSMPARYAYAGMGAAYENWGMCFKGNLSYDVSKGYLALKLATDNAEKLVVGDECLLLNSDSELANYSWLTDPIFTYVGKVGTTHYFENRNTEGWNTMLPAELMVVRSGKRNHLSTKALNIVSLSDPLDRDSDTYFAKNVIAIEHEYGTLINHPIPQTYLDNVISATATTFDDCWDLDRGDCGVDTLSIEVPPPGICNCLNVELTALNDLENTEPCQDLAFTVIYEVNGQVQTYVQSFGFGNMVNEGDVEEYQIDCSKGPISVIDAGITTECNSTQYDGMFEVSTSMSQVVSCGGSGSGHCLYAGFNPGDCTNDLSAPTGFYEDVFVLFTLNGVPQKININSHFVNTTTAICSTDLAGNSNYLVGCFPVEPLNVSFEIAAVGCELSDFTFYDCTTAGAGNGNPGAPYTGGGDPATVTLPNANFENGQRGIWRPMASYVYTEDYITASNANGDVDLAGSGIYNDLPLFNFNDSRWLDKRMLEAWRRSNEITAYAANGQESENRSATLNYSAALFGYANNVPIAVGQNMDRHDFGYESFEEMGGDVNGEYELNGNLFFRTQPTDVVFSQRYNLSALTDLSDVIWTDRVFEYNDMVPQKAKLNLIGEDGSRVLAEADITDRFRTIPLINKAASNPFLTKGTSYRLSSVKSLQNLSGYYSGTVTLQFCHDDQQSTISGNYGVTDNKAHTGEHSFYISGGLGTFPQPKININLGTKMTLSAWVSIDDVNKTTFDDSATYLEVRSVRFFPSGPIINGWQKIEGEFRFWEPDGLVDLKMSSTNRLTYFDDIRIFPSEGSMQSYVYYPENYRLQATLDQNNFATFYYYDESGQLFLIKKETEDGIKTIQETRGYIKNTLD